MNRVSIKMLLFVLITTIFAGVHSPVQPISVLKNHPKKALATAITALAGVELYNYLHRNYWGYKGVETDRKPGSTADQYGRAFSRLLFERGITEQFLFGVGTSAHQVEGDSNNNTWSETSPYVTEQFKKEYEQREGVPFQYAGKACDQVHRYKEDVQLIKALGVNTYRFSIAWDKVQPTPDMWDTQAIDYYKNLCNELVANGIYPVITLHHYTDPIWFAQKGGFSKEENIAYFVQYCTKMFTELKDCGVHLWFTFNSPSGYAFSVYESGRFPGMAPEERSATCMKQALTNILQAHKAVYQAGKMQYSEIKIGILKNIYQLDPWRICNPLDHLLCKIANNKVNDMIFTFFRKERCLDFIGLNYYSHGHLNSLHVFKTLFTKVIYSYFNGSNAQNMVSYNDNERRTANNNYTIYAQGLYRAIQTIHTEIARPCGIPIYITENGIAPVQEADRADFDEKYLYAVLQAVQDGCDVRGYIRWSLLDNYEWGSLADTHGKSIKPYGIYAVNFDSKSPDYLQRTLRHSASVYLQIVKAYRDGYVAVAAQ